VFTARYGLIPYIKQILLLAGAELTSWNLWPSQRLLSISLDPGRRLSSFFDLHLANFLFDVILQSYKAD